MIWLTIPGNDESDKHLEARDRRYSCLIFCKQTAENENKVFKNWKNCIALKRILALTTLDEKSFFSEILPFTFDTFDLGHLVCNSYIMHFFAACQLKMLMCSILFSFCKWLGSNMLMAEKLRYFFDSSCWQLATITTDTH